MRMAADSCPMISYTFLNKLMTQDYVINTANNFPTSTADTQYFTKL